MHNDFLDILVGNTQSQYTKTKDAAKEVYAAVFNTIVIATGYEASSIPKNH